MWLTKWKCHLVAHVLRDLLEVLLVLVGQNHLADAGAVGREHLVLDAADRQDPAAQGDLAGHGHIDPNRDLGEGRDQRDRRG